MSSLWICRSILAAASLVCLMAAPGWAVEEQAFHYDAHGRRDPFEPLVSPTGEMRMPRAAKGAASTLRLEGVLWDPVKPLAIVNGEIHRVGDDVQGCRLVEIRKNAVVVDTGEGGRSVIPVVVEEEPATTEVKGER